MSYANTAGIRAKSIRAIREIVELDGQHLLDDDIRKIIEYRVNDSSVATRESTLDLISKFVTKDKVYFEKYFSIFKERAFDPSLSVRKRAMTSMVKIIESG